MKAISLAIQQYIISTAEAYMGWLVTLAKQLRHRRKT
jgi:hypothetical protein